MLAGLDAEAARVPPPVLAVAATAVFAALIGRARSGGDPVPPDPARGLAEDVLRMLAGAPADPARVRALDTYLVTVADHGLNASTFAARVVASTRAGLLDAVVAALSALKGPLHGGAPGPVLDMLDAVGRPERAAAWVAAALARGDRLMGFGHRIYRTRDPRADVLADALDGVSSRYDALAAAVEAAGLAALARAKPDRPLATNVEFYTALVLDAAGLPRTLFTPAFAIGRSAGWAAHVMEQQAHGRLIRPDSRYVGPAVEAAA
jgi:citrate synthase